MYCLLGAMALSFPCLSQSKPKTPQSVAPTKQRKLGEFDRFLEQSQAPAKQKKAPTPVSDLDRLYAKYKDMETVTIYSSGEEVTANIEIVYNDGEKPKAIILTGESRNKALLNRIEAELIAQKERAGYRYGDGMSSFDGALYRKGSMYARYQIKEDIWDDKLSAGLLGKKYLFRFEVGDTKRAGSGKTETFTF